jgi:crotonobetainyl-CoA:carnitine CoA-transferase CaiB-like acyl-CoA transferase
VGPNEDATSVTEVLTGIRVLEVAAWTFVPSAGAVLADWGAEVIKVEHPVTGDPQRGLIESGFLPGDAGGVDYMIEIPNRGKRSIGIDLKNDDGRELLYRLAETCDVFLTNWLPDARRRLRIDVADIRARNPRIVYARGSGHGVRGPDAEKGGFDSSTYWARGGIGYALSPPDAEHPIRQRSAFGDVMGGLTIAGAISAALLHRERTGEPPVVDVSLLGLAVWNLSVDVVSSKLFDQADVYRYDPNALPNPTVGIYRTSDGRHLNLTLLESDRYWADLCEHVGHPELIDDERFNSHARRSENRRECTRTLREIFASRTLADWCERLATMQGVWSPLQTPRELHDDPQVSANGYLPTVTARSGTEFSLAANPVQFDEDAVHPAGAPEHGENTEEILLELGLSWDEIVEHKESGAIL